MRRAATTLAVAALCLAAPAAPAATITLGTYELQENTPNQKIPVYVVGEVGDPAVAGVNFNVQVADGGPEVPGGSIDGPTISYVQLVDDPNSLNYGLYHTDAYGPTFFDTPANWGHFGVCQYPPPLNNCWAHPQVFPENTAFTKGGKSIPVGVETLLAVVTIDTTGFFVGNVNDPWDLKIGGTVNGPTALLDGTPAPISLTVTEGQITLVPEPSTLVLVMTGMLAAAGLIWGRWR